MKIAHVSTFPDMKCGIAFYVSDLINSIPDVKHELFALHYGRNLTENARLHANVNNPDELSILASKISKYNCDVISLQHEFGIWGGENGEHIYHFLNKIDKPLITTLHTTFNKNSRPKIQGNIITDLIQKSSKIFVLSSKSKFTICSSFGITADNLSVIPHGVPTIKYKSPPLIPFHHPPKRNEWNIFSIGFLRPDKGFEEVLQSLCMLKKKGVKFKYIIASSVQPQFDEQYEYLCFLKQIIDNYKLTNNVKIIERFLDRSEQIDLIRNSHIGVFPYQESEHASSGTIPLVLSAGRPVLCTPFEFALAKEKEIKNGFFISNGFDHLSIEKAFLKFINGRNSYTDMCRTLYSYTKSWRWKTVGKIYMKSYKEAINGEN